MRAKPIFTSILLLIGSLAPLSAADFFASPQGSGSKTGANSANAAAAGRISEIFNTRMQAGDRLLLAAGTYENAKISLSNGGTAEKAKIIEGPPSESAPALFQSDWSIEIPDKGATCFTLDPGLSSVSLKNLSVRHYGVAFRAGASDANPRSFLRFENIQIEQVRHGFYLSDCDDLTILDCRMKRYSKHGFRLDQGCDRVLFKNISADGSEADPAWETKTEIFPFGFIVNNTGSPNTRIRFEDCVAKNHIKSNQTIKYTNGDGFVVEGNASEVSFLRCQAFRNQDGGFDLKVKDVNLTDCIATGHRRDFRIWTSGTLENCFAGWSETGLWSKEGTVSVRNSTFHGHQKSAAEIEAGSAVFTHCLVSTDSAEKEFKTQIGKVDWLESTTVPSAEAAFPNPDPAWDGSGNAFDSAKFPGKGYRSTRRSR